MDDEKRSELLVAQMEMQNIDDELQGIERQINKLIAKQESLQSRKEKLSKTMNTLQYQFETKDTKWDGDEYPWSSNVFSVLSKRFQIDAFRPLQKETINVTLSKKDCILIMPTGGGKSLCFQLPALVSEGFTLVVSPLVSLMEDQLMALKERNIEAAMLCSSIPLKQVTEIQNQLIDKNCPLKLLYVTPEKLAKSKRFMAKLEKAYGIGNISRIVIDEVHCASHWGHDFRPDYKILGILKRQFPSVPLLGLTATATEKVLDDVKDILNLDHTCTVFRASFNRPNLFYEVYKTSLDHKNLVKDIATRIKTQFNKMSGIVYCFSRKDCEDVANGLLQYDIKAHYYHGDLDPATKSKVHHSWTKGNLQVVVATIAFGMGIDKPNVRFVIHYSISKSMENYYQESGRAGRDDQKAWCILYFRFQDIFRQSAMVFTEKTGLQNLYNILRYCIDSKSCRRTLIGRHFAENWEPSKCQQMCDNCTRKKDLVEKDLSNDATTLVSILQNSKSKEERLTPLKLIDLWLGKGKASLRPTDITSYSKEDCESIITKLLVEQILTEDYHFTPYNTITYIIPGQRWSLMKRGQLTVKFELSTGKSCVGKAEKRSFVIDKDADNGKVGGVVMSEKKNKKKKTKIVIDSDSDEDFL